ncbi:MAG: efflux RND transporter periplasmic adaptor subunit [Candidatus Eremiobacteraeota bacterium]|nr:efflux RND transporter periplasmic adaptor subunit [Candidatus Eremiobacteraeota bacterium]NNM92845.1 efflux RND transporter periplasmic adaptor subunit [Candidatus Eremiobacteraeota bacterium]
MPGPIRMTISAATIAVLLAACGAKGARAPIPLDVEASPVTTGRIATYLSLDGQVAPYENSTLSFQQSGPVSAVYVNVGDRVTKGEILARIDPSTLEAQLRAAEATAMQSQANARGQQIDLPARNQANDAALSSAQAALANARLVFNQDTQLFNQKYLSQQALEAARSALAGAQSNYNTALANAQANPSNAEAVKAAQAAAQAAAAQANLIRTQIGQTALYAPFDGVVTARMMDPGTMASPAAPALQVSRVDLVWVNVNIPDGDLSYAHAGTPLTFTTTSLPGQVFRARLSAVNAVPTNGTLSYLARVKMQNPGEVLRGGMLVTAQLVKQIANNALIVPRSAIASVQNGDAVFVVNGTKAKQVSVKVGLQTDTESQILSGLSSGQSVITTRPDSLRNGSPIHVVPGGGQ